MISITVTTTYHDFRQLLENSWSGALNVLNYAQEQGQEDEAMERIADYCAMVQDSTGTLPSDTEVNDFIWFSLADAMNLYGDVEDED